MRLPVLPGNSGAAGDKTERDAVYRLADGTTAGAIRIGPGRGKLQLAMVSSEPSREPPHAPS